MSRRRSQSELSVSLFPFLAVLVCAMGALILLLLIITKQVRSQAVSTAPVAEVEEVVSHSLSPVLQPAQIELAENHAPAALPQPEIPEQILPDAVRFDEQKDGDHARMRLLEQQREELEKNRLQQKLIQLQIAELTERLAKEQKKKQELQARFVSLSRHKEELKKKVLLDQRTSSKKSNHLRKLQQELAQKQQELKKQKQIASEILGKLRIVTYDGETGIQRKPIFIECVAGNVIFQPEQVILKAEDLEKYAPQTHPLGYAVRALNKYRQQKADSQEPPYVLLIVRPDGIDEFYTSRRILGVQGIMFGYELVGQKQEFYFDQADRQAKKFLEQAIAQARQSSRQNQPGGFHLAGNGRFPEELEPLGKPGRLSRGNSIEPSKPTQRFNTFDRRTQQTDGKNTRGKLKENTTPSGADRAIANRNGKAPSVAKGLARNGSRFSPSGQPTLSKGKWDSSESQTSKKNQPASTTGTPQEQLKQLLSRSQGLGLGNPDLFPQLNSLSSRAKHLKRGTPDSLISLERQLVVKIDLTTLQVGRQKPVSISFAEADIETQRKFLNSLESEMSNWPDPPRGFRWVPGFRLMVAPGGNQMAFRIEAVAKELKLRTETGFQMGRSNANQLFK